jgi:hypothetical protein
MACTKNLPAKALPPLQSTTGERCFLTLCKKDITPATASAPLLLLTGRRVALA